MLPTICKLEAVLPRTAEKAALRIRLPRTMTLSARNTLMALPYWPEPPDLFMTPSMRLSTTIVPSSPGSLRQIRMPPLPAPRTVLPAMRSPRASTEKIAASAALIVFPVTSPAMASSAMPLRPALIISQSAMRTERPCAKCNNPRRSGSGMPAPSSTRPLMPRWSLPVADIIDGPPDMTMRVAPATPAMAAKGGSCNDPAR